MTNKPQNITEKLWQRQLTLLKYKQTFRDTVAQNPRQNISPLTNNRCYRN